MDETLRHQALAWIRDDPDPATAAELDALVAADDEAAVAERFDGRLAFGTAGIRGEVAAGPNRINLAVVRQTAWGLGQFLLDRGPKPGRAELHVVVGNDARPDSPRFAADMARTLAAMGVRVELFDRPVPTPIVAWQARQVESDAAVVVTASHNPRPDNGVKVYDDRGIQIIAPWDRQIAESIDRAPGAAGIATSTQGITALGPEVESAYRASVVASQVLVPTAGSDLTIVATALHGVGAGPLERLLADAGHAVLQVPEQREPDGTFPTVAFPNPEEPGALDLALALAAKVGADLVLANDPDADRLAVAIPDGAGGHRPLTGNQVGSLLGDALLAAVSANGAAAVANSVVASSIVSSPQLAAIAAHHGAQHRSTLTGFKWIWTALLDAEDNGKVPLFGYEEALGHAVAPIVRDKDGLSAALAIVTLAANEAGRGRTLADRLDDLARSTGLWVSSQASRRFEGDDAQGDMDLAMARLRDRAPRQLGGYEVLETRDHLDEDGGRPPWLGAQNLLEFSVRGADGEAAPNGRVLVRPSGTEPKLKVYADLQAPVADPAQPRADEIALQARASELAQAVLAAL